MQTALETLTEYNLPMVSLYELMGKHLDDAQVRRLTGCLANVGYPQAFEGGSAMILDPQVVVTAIGVVTMLSGPGSRSLPAFEELRLELAELKADQKYLIVGTEPLGVE